MPSATTTCTILIPHLLPPRELQGDNGNAISRDLHLPALRKLLARARHIAQPGLDAIAWLCSAFGVTRQQDWPVAPISLVNDGDNPGDRYWLRADPVHLEPRRDALVLTDPTLLNITNDEAEKISVTLKQHLAQDDCVFASPHPARWYLGLAAAPKVQTTALADAIGRDTRHFMLAGTDALRWQRTMTELQMLLHSHPVNAEREARGQFPINSLWPWGGGIMPPAGKSQYRAIWSDDDMVRALACHVHCDVRNTPAIFNHVASDISVNANELIVLNAPSDAMRRGDPGAWRDAITHLETNWFAPLLASLKSRTLTEINIVHSDAEGCVQFNVRPWDLYKIFNKNKYL